MANTIIACADCRLTGMGASKAEAAQHAATHDALLHNGHRTATVRHA